MDTSSEGGFMNASDYEQIINDLKTDGTFCEYKFSPPEMNFSRIKMEDVADSTDEHKLVMGCSPTSTLPCIDPYPGPYNFELMLDTTTMHKRSWVYSELLQKVYIDMNKTLLIQFRLSTPVGGLRVRALPVYSTADFLNIPVQRCALHMLNCDPQHQAHCENNKICFCPSYNWVRHVVQSSHSGAMYDYDSSSDRHSVVVPLDLPQPGADTVVVAYHFTCKTSCPQGMQRRPISVIFTLETDHGDVVGRQCLSIKICSCPKRDKEREEVDNPLSECWSSLKACTKTKKKSEYKGYSKKAKMEAGLQLRNENQVEQKKYDVLKDSIISVSEKVDKITQKVDEIEAMQHKTVEILLTLSQQISSRE